jgi:hypothetical protein
MFRGKNLALVTILAIVTVVTLWYAVSNSGGT